MLADFQLMVSVCPSHAIEMLVMQERELAAKPSTAEGQKYISTTNTKDARKSLLL